MPGYGRHSDDEPELRLPAGLVDDLKRLYTPPGTVPRGVDDAVGERAWRHCDGLRARRRIRWWGRIGVAAAAVFLIFFLRDVWQGPKVQPVALPPIVGLADFNRDGHINILDAFALARMLERGGPVDQTWDFNHDGVVDRADVDAIAMAAVRLDGGTTS
ncbi:MAG TPA: dockerin type I domain-containing protein [Phycisphaerae bacterium]|nr:dockerin type I domain-containing protein [Phycisphaerae bacterium]